MWFVHSDLEKLGGSLPAVRELRKKKEEIRTASAWVLGTASQNNALVQDQVMSFTIHE
jgi:hsp70-interacting protein